MIVNAGKLKLLTLQLSAVAAYEWRLFTNNFTVAAGTVLSDLTQAAWTSYAPVTVGAMGAAAIVAGKAVSVPNTPPTFTNGTVSPVTYYGWMLVDPSAGGTLIAAVNQGLQTLNAGQSVSLSGSLSDDTA